MTTKTINVNMKVGNGAMPVAMLVQVASRFESKVYIVQDDKKINAKSIMGMMALGLTNGKDVSVMAEGTDEEEAVAAVGAFLNGETQN